MPQHLQNQNNKKVLLILADPLSSRLFLSSDIIQNLASGINESLEIVATFDIDNIIDYKQWDNTGLKTEVKSHQSIREIMNLNMWKKFYILMDSWLEKRFGFFPLAVRQSLIHGFNAGRITRGSSNPFMNYWNGWPFPRSKKLFEWMYLWNYRKNRFTDPRIGEYMKQNFSALVVSNLQMPGVQPYIRIAGSMGIPIIGHIASWDHPVGKGVVYPYCSKYIVQNDFMKDALVKYHKIDPSLIEKTGWPQMDIFSEKSSLQDYDDLLESYGLDPKIPCVLIAGNSEKNAPYEPNFIKRFVEWRDANGGQGYFSIIFRPHPRDLFYKGREQKFFEALNKPGVYIQKANYSDIDVIRILVQHVSCVVTNGGSILLDSIVNDRPVVCHLYDEGGVKGENVALRNAKGLHYKNLMESGSFYISNNFKEAVNGLTRSLTNPGELFNARKAISLCIIGELDGKAGLRVANAIKSSIANSMTH